MFGLTKREQRWKAEQQAAEVLAALAGTALRAAAEIRVAEAKTDAEELSRLRMLYDELLMAVGNKYPGETRHETALRYIRTAEIPVSGQAKDCGPNVAGNRLAEGKSELTGLLGGPNRSEKE